jgi:hypothetical protein
MGASVLGPSPGGGKKLTLHPHLKSVESRVCVRRRNSYGILSAGLRLGVSDFELLDELLRKSGA